MSERTTAKGKVMGGHLMAQTLEPRMVDGTSIGMNFDGTDELPERVTVFTRFSTAYFFVHKSPTQELQS